MKQLIALFVLVLLTACNTHKKYSDFDYSYSRSGGYAPIYENLLIKNKKAHYSLEGQGKNIKKDFSITAVDEANIQKVLEENNFRMIREDYKKLYDFISTTINVKKGSQSASKTDASLIMPSDQKRWENVQQVFQDIINRNIATTTK